MKIAYFDKVCTKSWGFILLLLLFFASEIYFVITHRCFSVILIEEIASPPPTEYAVGSHYTNQPSLDPLTELLPEPDQCSEVSQLTDKFRSGNLQRLPPFTFKDHNN